jgi:hypothetical protein
VIMILFMLTCVLVLLVQSESQFERRVTKGTYSCRVD